MDDFQTEYEKIMENPPESFSEEPTQDTLHIYQLGIDTILATSQLDQKVAILEKLIFLFPSNCVLYYYMGCILKDTDQERALLWFRMCFAMNKGYVENMLDLTKILLNKKYRNYAKYLFEKNIVNIHEVKDVRFELLYGTLHFLEEKKYEGLAFFQSLLGKTESIPNPSSEVSILKNIIYFNLSEVYCSTSDISNSIAYLQKMFEQSEANLPLKNQESVPSTIIDDQILYNAYHSYMLKCDYVYTDHAYRNEIGNQFAQLIYRNCGEPTVRIPRTPSSESRSFTPGSSATSLCVGTVEPLRIGYLSNSFFFHAISHFIFPILENHTSALFQVYVITELKKATSTKYITHLVQLGIQIIDISDKNTTDAANLLYSLKLDILVDLDGHEKDNRMDILAKKPAPVQIAYLGYPNTTNVDFIHYRIVDHITDPLNSTQFYSETRIYMPRCFLLYRPLLHFGEEPCEKKPDGRIVLGSINKESKSSPQTLTTWKKILEMTTNTVLLIKLDDENIEQRRQFYIQTWGFPEDRIQLIPYGNNEKYVELFRQIDILLDPFPYSGTNTTCNALYNSVPVITLYHKDYHAHNVTSSILLHIGYGELVSYTLDEYMDKTADLCKDTYRLYTYKQNIALKFKEYMNPSAFMKDYEKMLLQWKP